MQDIIIGIFLRSLLVSHIQNIAIIYEDSLLKLVIDEVQSIGESQTRDHIFSVNSTEYFVSMKNAYLESNQEEAFPPVNGHAC